MEGGTGLSTAMPVEVVVVIVVVIVGTSWGTPRGVEGVEAREGRGVVVGVAGSVIEAAAQDEDDDEDEDEDEDGIAAAAARAAAALMAAVATSVAVGALEHDEDTLVTGSYSGTWCGGEGVASLALGLPLFTEALFSSFTLQVEIRVRNFCLSTTATLLSEVVILERKKWPEATIGVC